MAAGSWYFTGDQGYVPSEDYRLLVDARRQLLETLDEGNAALQGARVRSIARQQRWKRAYETIVRQTNNVDADDYASNAALARFPSIARERGNGEKEPRPQTVNDDDDATDYDAERPLIEQLLAMAMPADAGAVAVAPVAFRAKRREVLLAGIDEGLATLKAANPELDTRELERRLRSDELLERFPLTEDELRAIFFRALDAVATELRGKRVASDADAYFYANVVHWLPVRAMAEEWFAEWKKDVNLGEDAVLKRLESDVRALVYDWRGQVFASVERRSASLRERGNIASIIRTLDDAAPKTWSTRFSLIAYVQQVEWRLATLEARLAETESMRAVPLLIERNAVDRSPLLFPVRAQYSGGERPAATYSVERFDRATLTTTGGEARDQQPDSIWPLPDARGGLYRLVVVETATGTRIASRWIDVRRMAECVRCANRFDVDDVKSRVFGECHWRERPIDGERDRFMRTLRLPVHLEVLRKSLPYGEPFDMTRPLPSRQEAARRYCTLDGLLERNSGGKLPDGRTDIVPLLTRIAKEAKLSSDRAFARTMKTRLAVFAAAAAVNTNNPFASTPPVTRDAIIRSDVWYDGTPLPFTRDEMLFDEVAAATYDRLSTLAPSEAEFVGIHSATNTQPDVERFGGVQGSIRARMPVDFDALHRAAAGGDFRLVDAYNALVQFGPVLELAAGGESSLKRLGVEEILAWWT